MLNHSTNTKEQHITNGYQTHEYFTQRYLHFRPIEQPNRVPEYEQLPASCKHMSWNKARRNNNRICADLWSGLEKTTINHLSFKETFRSTCRHQDQRSVSFHHNIRIDTDTQTECHRHEGLPKRSYANSWATFQSWFIFLTDSDILWLSNEHQIIQDNWNYNTMSKRIPLGWRN